MNLENVVENLFSKISQLIDILCNAFKGLFLKIKGLFVRPDLSNIDFDLLNCLGFDYTNYKCDKCGGSLMKSRKHYDEKIIYRCFDCGKIHEAYKNNVLGRFNMRK